jgi:hypothetical protein
MSNIQEKDKIREMVMALARSKSDPSYLDVARAAGAEVMAEKTERISEELFTESEETGAEEVVAEDEKSEDDDESDSTMEGSLGGAAKRHARAGHKDMNSRQRAIAKGSRNQATKLNRPE